MTLGYCVVCGKLVTICQAGQEWGTRERRWFPIPHEESPEGKLCPGAKRKVG